ncbi:RICIN domain-containing protein [Glycomyces sp. L485]|uniref:rhamnogalacturonan lyase family protein n=1 Tax=Glycomyces sp. L485 TaxID=2909235 RepID=UPI001F4AF847|nr:RICIN domain-containing protein [Glycomyces sp. L485]MCH7231299.1 RICIN domain-containing protein [Glycomyces sp. L485]
MRTPRIRRLKSLTALAVAALVAAAMFIFNPFGASAQVDTDAWYIIESRSSGLVLDIEGASTQTGAELVQWNRTDAESQQFRFIDAGDGYHRIQARHSNMVLDVWERNPDDGATIAQYTDQNGTNQQWQVQESGGYATFVNRFSDKALDVWEKSTTAGDRISQYTPNGGTNQQWRLIPVDGDEPTDPPTTGGPGDPGQGGDGRYEVEALTRGVTVVPSGGGNLVSWRLLGTDAEDAAFNVYRGDTKLNSSPITGATNYLDGSGSSGSQYTVRAVTDGTEGSASGVEVRFNSSGYFDVPIQRPAGGTTPSGESYSYVANDTSAADLDGDGTYELIVKWDPTNAHDNAHDGYTGNVYLDAYRLNGQRLWRIDLGRNIRAGAHYTQFQVYDYDGDGAAELAVKTADGTRDANGTVIGSSSADHRNSSGRILAGPEFLTIFDGRTGAAMDTVNYQPARGNVSSWGDNYGNRVDRFLAGTAYLDGETPSMIFSRGYYTRTVIWAVDWDGQDLTTRWTFDSNQAGSQYEGQGAHSLSIADLDGDGRQDVVFGAMAIGSNGQALWNTRLGHGDALHVSDFVPSNPGQEVYMPSEWTSGPSSRLVDGDNGSIIFQTPRTGNDNGRGVAGNVWSGNPGGEFWSSSVGGMQDASGSNIGSKPSSTNFLSWWDGDGERELLNGTTIDNYSPGQRLLTGSGVSSNNGTKSTPALSADLFGDWREEVVWRTSNSSALRIYATPHETDLRIPTLMHDIQYRVAIAWQNTGYNQPPHPSFYIGSDVTAYPWPDVHTP